MAAPNDPLYDEQWHFDLIGDIEAIWEDYDGSGVTVAVYDDGVEYTHEDLDGNYDASMHFSYEGIIYDPMPLTDADGHGTSCAGLIGAESDNGTGGTGVASGVTLTGVNYLEDIQYQSDEIYEAAMYYAENFDIMSNSWGWGGIFTRQQNLNTATSSAATDTAIFAAISETGRDGLGTIIVKAAGNETSNVNGDGWNVSRHTITVAATDERGNATYYTNYGSSVLITAPASAVTTDRSGEAGYNGSGSDTDSLDPDYTSEFGGTSAATPTVAGVVALMLEANPDLGWRDVNMILSMSASHTGSDIDGAKTRYEVGNWMVMGGTEWNAGGTIYHQSYGYGMVDAYTAVRFSEAWSVLYATSGPQTSANEQVAVATYAGASVAIADGDGTAGTGQAQLDIVSTTSIQIDTIYVTLTLQHTDMADLRIYLVAPDGEMIPLILEGDATGNVADNGVTWTFGVEALRGYDSAGTWSIVIEDMETGATGTVSGAEIEFFGSTATVDDVYHFTDDFLMMQSVEASRSSLSDTNGGYDWLNFSAIAGGIEAEMFAGGTIAVAGADWLLLDAAGDQFENFFAGDGADTVYGNSLENQVEGARGKDSIMSAAAADVLSGGEDADRLKGQSGRDSLYGEEGNDLLTGGAGLDELTGGSGRDIFVFRDDFGRDTVTDFQNDFDTLYLEEDLWGGGLTVEEVLAEFGRVDGDDLLLDFGVNEIRIEGFTSLNALADDIIIV